MKQDSSLDRMVSYYQKEMQYLLHSGRQFASQYPKVARYLDFHQTGSDDPHVQRLLESFAFLTGRLQSEIDDRFSSFTGSLLDTLYPQFTQPIPSSTIVQMNPTPQMGPQLSGSLVPKGTQLLATAEEGQICRFQSTMDLTLFPLEIQDFSYIRSQLCDIPVAHLRSPWVLRLRVRSFSGDLSAFTIPKLCFHISGDILTRHRIFEWLFTYSPQGNTPVFVQPEGSSIASLLPLDALKPVGFDEQESLLPFPAQTHQAYRLLLEYFAFPQKFLFFEINHLPKLQGKFFDILIPLGENAQTERFSLSRQHIQLNCVPAVNLFFKTSEPIRLNHRQVEYKLVGDQRQEAITEVHSILKVSSSADQSASIQTYAPYFSFNHDVQALDTPCFWVARRENSTLAERPGTDVFLSFVDYHLNPSLPPNQTVYAHTLCTNRNLAESVPAGAQLQPLGNLTGVIAKTLERPTPEIIPNLDGETQWRLISHLSINHVGICASAQSVEPLRELLRLYSFMEYSNKQSEAEAIMALSYQKGMGRLGQDAWRGFVPKLAIRLVVDESRPNTHGLFLLSLVLDELFRLSASFNTLIETTLVSHQRQEVWKKWPSQIAIQPSL
ncbi:MAG: type VI secretion system baseplate subunit TssF [Alphaproteobacteria bacterium]